MRDRCTKLPSNFFREMNIFQIRFIVCYLHKLLQFSFIRSFKFFLFMRKNDIILLIRRKQIVLY